MKALALESSGDFCSVALYIDGEVEHRLGEASVQQHSRILLPMQEALLKTVGLALAELDFICCGIGPGSFTGVRVATALTQGLAYGANLPVLGISTLSCMAHSLSEHSTGQALVLLDARMDELYWAHYRFEDSRPVIMREESLSKPDELVALSKELGMEHCIGIGNGWDHYQSELTALAEQCQSVDASLRPSASLVARLAVAELESGTAQLQTADLLQPLYVRNRVTHQGRR